MPLYVRHRESFEKIGFTTKVTKREFYETCCRESRIIDQRPCDRAERRNQTIRPVISSCTSCPSWYHSNAVQRGNQVEIRKKKPGQINDESIERDQLNRHDCRTTRSSAPGSTQLLTTSNDGLNGGFQSQTKVPCHSVVVRERLITRER